MKENENRHAFFIETFGLIHTDRKKFTYRLDSPKFSVQEKRLLKGFLEFYRNHKAQSLAHLRMSPIADPFLEGVRFYLIGLVYNQNSHFRYAIENLEKSVSIFNTTENYGFIINPVSLLIITHSNRKEVKKMGTWIRELRKVKPASHIGELMIYHCEILYSFMSGDGQRTEELLKNAESLGHPEYKSFHPHFLVIQMSLMISEKRYAECKQVLEKYKKTAENAIVKANYAYIKSMLEHLHEQKPLYIYAERYKEFPELHEQLEVIKNLSTGSLDLAKKYWNRLHQHNPDLYQENFHFAGDECLFSQALEKYQDFTQETEWDAEKIKSIPSKMDRLDFLLTNAKEPLQAETMIRLIWGEDVSEQSLARLRKLISLYSKEKNLRVVANRQSYKVDKKSRD